MFAGAEFELGWDAEVDAEAELGGRSAVHEGEERGGDGFEDAAGLKDGGGADLAPARPRTGLTG